jgi:uncharacterized protein
MKMALDDTAGLNTVRSYEPGRLRVRDKTFDSSLVLLPDHLIEDWEPTSANQLHAKHFTPLIDLAPEVVLLGTGDRQVFPEPGVFTLLMDMGIGFEVMDNAAACRTYNILVGEGRRAALTIIIP